MSVYSNEDHPLRPHFNFRKELWDSPIAEISFPFPHWVREGLLDYILKKNFTKGIVQHDNNEDQYSSSHFYNLLCDADEYKEIAKFKSYISELIRYYCANAWSVPDIENIQIEAKSFANLQLKGERTFPHYHNGFDGVVVSYLTVGNEFDVNLNNNTLMVKTGQSESSTEPQNTLWTRNTTKTYNKDFERQGNFIMIDPRGAPNYPYDRKCVGITPKSGSHIFHPAYLWHESNTFSGNGIRVCIGTNFKISNGSDTLDSLVTL